MRVLDRLPKLNKCCFCVNHSIGVKLIAIVELLCWTIILGAAIATLFVPEWTKPEHSAHQGGNGKHLQAGGAARGGGIDERKKIFEMTISILTICFANLAILLAILLLAGAVNKRPRLVEIWLLAHLIFLLLSIPWIVAMCFSTNWILSCAVFSIIAVKMFWWISVNGYRFQMRQEEFLYHTAPLHDPGSDVVIMKGTRPLSDLSPYSPTTQPK